MMSRAGGAAIVCAALLSGCAGNPETPRVATAKEATDIIAPLIPVISSVKTCVGKELRPPLEDRRRNAEFDARDENLLNRIGSWIERIFSTDEPAASNWSLFRNGKEVTLSSEETRQFDMLLQEATRASLPDGKLALTLPKGAVACTDQDEKADVVSGEPVYRFYYSRPVIVGNVAFVEEGGVCGGLCGGGSLKVLVKHGETWAEAAEQMTWIA